MSLAGWNVLSGRLQPLGASSLELEAIQAAYLGMSSAEQAALDTLVAGLAGADLLTMLTTWRSSGAPFQAGFPGGGLPFGTGVAVLTGSPADDAYPIAAGTGRRLTGISSGQVPALPWLGLNANHAASGAFGGGQTMFSNLGLLYTREWAGQGVTNDGSGHPLATDLATIASIGQIPVLILSPTGYGTASPYITGAAIASYAAWFVAQVQAVEAAHPTLGTLYEIDNEPWNFYTPAATAAQYADVVLAVLNACQAAGLDLTRIYAMIKDNAWVAAMYAEQATLKTLVEGWSIHPYGPPPPGFASTGAGIASVPALRETITGSGAGNILLSEIGISDQTISGTPSGANLAAATAAQAQEWMSDLLDQAAAYRQAGWLKALLLYHRSAANYALVQVNSFSSPYALNDGTLTAGGKALVNFALRMRPVNNQGYAPRTPGIYLPYDDGCFAVTMYPEAAGDAVQIVAGKLHLFRLRVDVYDFVGHLTTWIDTAGSSLTTGGCFYGVYQQQLASGAGSYVLVGQTADQAASWTGTGRQMKDLASGFSAVPGYYWLAILGNGSTMPKFRGVLAGDQLNLGNFGALPQRVMQSVATFTALPASLDLSSGSVASASAFTSGVLAAMN